MRVSVIIKPAGSHIYTFLNLWVREWKHTKIILFTLKLWSLLGTSRSIKHILNTSRGFLLHEGKHRSDIYIRKSSIYWICSSLKKDTPDSLMHHCAAWIWAYSSVWVNWSHSLHESLRSHVVFPGSCNLSSIWTYLFGVREIQKHALKLHTSHCSCQNISFHTWLHVVNC